jgi:hypothetical protein
METRPTYENLIVLITAIEELENYDLTVLFQLIDKLAHREIKSEWKFGINKIDTTTPF